MKPLRASILLFASLLLNQLPMLAGDALADDSLFDQKGFRSERPTSSLLPFEHIDPLSGNLILAIDDLVLPGNAGFALRVRRTYNSKIFPTCIQGGVCSYVPEDNSWVGVGWSLHFGRIRSSTNSNGSRPIIEMPDGSLHPTFLDNAGLVTKEFWRLNYDTAGDPEVWLPDGTVYKFTYRGSMPGPASYYAREIIDKFGNTISITYSSNRQDAIDSIVQTVEGSGSSSRTITFATTASGNLQSMSFSGRTWTYGQSFTGVYGQSLLMSVSPPIGPSWNYSYRLPGAGVGTYELLSWTTPNGGTASYAYVTQAFRVGTYLQTYSRAISSRTTSGRAVPPGTWTYAYHQGTDQNKTVVTSPCDVKTYTFFGIGPTAFGSTPVWKIGVVERIDTGTMQSEVFTWRASEILSGDDQFVGVHYDLATYIPLIESVAINRDGKVYTTTNSYHTVNHNDYGRPYQIQEVGELTRTTTKVFDYGFSSYIVDKIASDTVSIGTGTFTNSYTYDHATGFLTQQILHGVATSFTPSLRGNVASSTDADGRVTSFTYQYGVVRTTQTPEYTIQRTINPDGTVASERRGAEASTLYQYDAAGRLIEIDPPLGNSTTVSYGASGQSVTKTRSSNSVITSLDGFGRTIGSSDSVGVQTSITFDACGRQTFASYPFSGTATGTTIVYDELSRVRERQHPGGATVRYDFAGSEVTVTDELNRTTLLGYKAFGSPDDSRLMSVRDAGQYLTTYSYNAAGSLLSTSGPVSGTRSWTYNSRNQLVQESIPERGLVTYGRDLSGTMLWKSDPLQTVNYNYDGNRRLIRIIAPGQADTIIDYDIWDRRTSITRTGLSTTYTYDVAGRLRTQVDSIQGRLFTTVYDYDGNDNLTYLQYPSGRSLSMTYDAGNRLTRVADSSGSPYASQISYHPSGAVSSFTAGNGLTHSTGFNARYWPSTLNAGGVLNLTYDYYATGDVSAISDARSGMNQSFTYDTLGRLTGANGPWGTGSFTFDPAGNRLSKSVGGNQTFQYSSQNHLLSASYDTKGNIIGDGVGTYTFDSLDRMSSATVGSVTTNYDYDVDAWRVRKTGPGGTNYYVRGIGGTLLAEYQEACQGQPQLVREYVYAGSRLIASIRSPLQTATLSWTSTSGSVGESAGAFGGAVRMTTSDGQPLLCPAIAQYHTEPGSAVAPADFLATEGLVTFPTNSLSGATQAVSVSIVNDPRDEADETFELKLAGMGSANVGVPTESVLIVDDDPLPQISVTASAVTEPDYASVTLSFAVALSGQTDRPVSFDYGTANGSAIAGIDYTAVSGTVALPPGTTTATISVPVLGDRLGEPTEQFSLLLTNPTLATLASTSVAGTIADNDVHPPYDFDGDHRSDYAVFRPSTISWHVRQSTAGDTGVWGWGASGDVPTPGDFDGDGRTDIAVYRPTGGQWYVRYSSNGVTASYPAWGITTDKPVLADYDGDGRTDIALYRARSGSDPSSYWFVKTSSSNYTQFYAVGWGDTNDLPAPADFDGDGKADIAVFRPSNGLWYVIQSSTGQATWYSLGMVGDKLVPADYDGDGKADVAVFRPATGTWQIRSSSTGLINSIWWGQAGDVPVPADYDGDGKSDVALFRPSDGIWYVMFSGSSPGGTWWGQNGDIPLSMAPQPTNPIQ